MTAATTTILRAIWDPKLFKAWFRDPASWSAWFAFLKALFALPLSEEDLAVYRRCTGRTEPPSAPATEAWLVCGRRAGKSFMLALIATYLACFHQYRRHLAPGERGTVMIIARDRKQTRIILSYIRALLTEIPMLSRMIERETADSFELEGDVTIEVQTASYRSVRGYAIIAALCDELAFWPHDEAADPDYAVIDALRPGMAQFPNAMLLCASSPYSRRGALHDAYKRHYAQDGDPVLVWKAATRVMNPTVPQSVIDTAMARDASDAMAEWMAEFRTDIESFVPIEVVERCVGDYVEHPPLSNCAYHAFTDPSGGSADSFTLAIAHKDGERVVVDMVREVKPPFSPEATINDFCLLLKAYRVKRVTGDRYAGEFAREPFRRRGITYFVAEKPRSDLYRDLLPALNSGRVMLPRNERLINQLVGLERRTTRAGRDSIDHAPGGHDDVANAVAGVFDAVAEERARFPRAILSNYEGTGVGLFADSIDPREWAAAAANVAAGSAPSNIAAGSDVPSDFTMRLNGFDLDKPIEPPPYNLHPHGPTQEELQAQERQPK
jgi:hypothetical protein